MMLVINETFEVALVILLSLRRGHWVVSRRPRRWSKCRTGSTVSGMLVLEGRIPLLARMWTCVITLFGVCGFCTTHKPMPRRRKRYRNCANVGKRSARGCYDFSPVEASCRERQILAPLLHMTPQRQNQACPFETSSLRLFFHPSSR